MINIFWLNCNLSVWRWRNGVGMSSKKDPKWWTHAGGNWDFDIRELFQQINGIPMTLMPALSITLLPIKTTSSILLEPFYSFKSMPNFVKRLIIRGRCIRATFTDLEKPVAFWGLLMSTHSFRIQITFNYNAFLYFLCSIAIFQRGDAAWRITFVFSTAENIDQGQNESTFSRTTTWILQSAKGMARATESPRYYRMEFKYGRCCTVQTIEWTR